MTDVDRLRDAEQRLREDLRRTLVPPPTPVTLSAAVDRLAANPPPAERGRGVPVGSRRLLEAVAGIAAVVALAVGILAVSQLPNQHSVATTPHPTLPAAVASPLPPAAANPTLLESGAWVDASTLWTIDSHRNLRVSEDGGQTWSEPRSLPTSDDVGFGMFDARHGYLAQAVRASRASHTWQFLLNRTSDGGRTWGDAIVAGTLDVPDGDEVFIEVHFVDAQHGIFMATSHAGTAADGSAANTACVTFETDDGGATWASTDGACLSGVPVTWSSPKVGVISYSSTAPAVNVTLDGGRSWSFGSVPVPAGTIGFSPLLVAAAAAQPVRLFGTTIADGELAPQQVYEADPFGGNWSPAYQPADLPRINPGLAWALDANHWLAMSEVESLGGMDLHESWDAGRSWTQVAHAAVQPGGMQWLDRLHGAVQGVPIRCDGGSCSGNGTILFTNDGGQTWHEVPF